MRPFGYAAVLACALVSAQPLGVVRAQSSGPPPASAGPADTRACASDSDCHAPGRHHGRCLTASLAAQYTQSFRDCAEGHAWRAAHAVGTCVFDECRDNDSPGGNGCARDEMCSTLEMVPYPQRVCLHSACTADSQCRRQAGGICASYFNAGRCQHGGWACSYPADVCAPRDPRRMCPVVPGLLPYCAPRNGRFVCVQEPSTPPRPPR